MRFILLYFNCIDYICSKDRYLFANGFCRISPFLIIQPFYLEVDKAHLCPVFNPKGVCQLQCVNCRGRKHGLGSCGRDQDLPYLGIRTIGFLDDTKTGEIVGIKILGRINDIEQIVNKYFIDEIYVTIPSERKIAAEIIQKGTKMGRSVRIVAEYFSLPYRQVKLNYIGAIPLMTYFEKIGHDTDSIAKRLLDIAISSLILILFLPLFAIVTFLIKLESPGPVFYVSKRSGKKGVIFDLYKFRSMVRNADSYKETLKDKSEVEGPIFKIRNDPRLTKMGGSCVNTA